jgi:group I intron endonuclease
MTKPTRLYCITARSTGRFYVGITTKTVAERWNGHKSDARRGAAHHLSKAIRKYGPTEFLVEEMFQYDTLEEAQYAEEDIIRQLDLTRTGYNSSFGGECAALFTGRTHTPETRAKMSAAAKGRVISDEQRRKLAVSMRRVWALRRGVDTRVQNHDTLMIGTV